MKMLADLNYNSIFPVLELSNLQTITSEQLTELRWVLQQDANHEEENRKWGKKMQQNFLEDALLIRIVVLT